MKKNKLIISFFLIKQTFSSLTQLMNPTNPDHCRKSSCGKLVASSSSSHDLRDKILLVNQRAFETFWNDINFSPSSSCICVPPWFSTALQTRTHMELYLITCLLMDTIFMSLYSVPPQRCLLWWLLFLSLQKHCRWRNMWCRNSWCGCASDIIYGTRKIPVLRTCLCSLCSCVSFCLGKKLGNILTLIRSLGVCHHLSLSPLKVGLKLRPQNCFNPNTCTKVFPLQVRKSFSSSRELPPVFGRPRRFHAKRGWPKPSTPPDMLEPFWCLFPWRQNASFLL